MNPKASIVLVGGLAALLVSYSSVTVKTTGATKTTSTVVSASPGPYLEFNECMLEYCEGSRCLGCYSVINSGDTDSPYPPECEGCSTNSIL